MEKCRGRTSKSWPSNRSHLETGHRKEFVSGNQEKVPKKSILLYSILTLLLLIEINPNKVHFIA
jgi:hypothetical protein